jgi:uncharacterized protein (DUF2384 family)
VRHHAIERATGGATVADLAERLERAATRTGLEQGELTPLLGDNSDAQRVLALVGVLEQLGEVLRPRPAHDWLLTPSALLASERPADLLRAGEHERVLGAIDALAEGVCI